MHACIERERERESFSWLGRLGAATGDSRLDAALHGAAGLWALLVCHSFYRTTQIVPGLPAGATRLKQDSQCNHLLLG